MAKTYSKMINLGSKAFGFNLPDVVSDKNISFYNELNNYTGSVVMFICNHCPYVKHVIEAIVELAKDYQAKNIRFFAINSNDIISYPDDSPPKMKDFAKENQFTFPYLLDETQEVAKAYQAACTPDFFIFDSDDFLVYRGQLDDSRPGNDIKPNGESVRNALNYLLQGNKIPEDMQKPSIGCNIKWK